MTKRFLPLCSKISVYKSLIQVVKLFFFHFFITYFVQLFKVRKCVFEGIHNVKLYKIQSVLKSTKEQIYTYEKHQYDEQKP